MNRVALRECCRFLSGGTPSKATAEFWTGNIPWYSPKDIKKLDLVDSQDHISDAAVSASATQIVLPGTIFVVGRSGVLAHTLPVGIVNHRASFNQDIKAIVPNPEIDADYLALFLKAQESFVLSSGVKIGATVHSLKSGFIEALEIPCFELQEQARIAARLKSQLAAVEKARQAAQAQLSEAKKLIPAILETAFNDFGDAEWVTIGSVARTTSGTTPSRSRKEFWQPPKFPWVKTGEVAFTPIRQTEESVSERAFAECSLPLLPPGTVLVAMYGQGKTRGQSAVLEVAATTNQACFAILPSERLDPEYLQCWLRHSYQTLRAQSEARGGNQSNLNGEILNAFEVPLLPLDRQRSMARQIKSAIAEVELLQSRLEQQMSDIEQLVSTVLAQAFDFQGEENHD